jgi:hypothetical protein
MVPLGRSRRHFLKTSGLLPAAPVILPSPVWSQATAPGKRLTLGCMGMGIVMKSHLRNFLERDDVEVRAVCDVDTTCREAAKQRVDAAYSKITGAAYGGCAAYNDFREILTRADIDAIRDVEIGASSATACHVMNFAYRYGANASWDPARTRFISGGDAKWLTRDHYRDGWKV